MRRGRTWLALPLVAAVVALPAGAAALRPPLSLPPHVEVVVEVTSYGEQPRDLLALLVPFLARLQFAQPVPAGLADPRDGSGAFAHPDGDFVVTVGRYNCIRVTYYSRVPGAGPGRAAPRERAGAFQLALLDFLEGLPMPRPVPREVAWGSRYCSF